jgi:hypothetical protein
MTGDKIGRRNREATLITLALVVPCGLACAGSVFPAVDNIVGAILIVLGGCVLAFLAARWVRRWVRESAEDRADAVTAAIWRQRYAPDLLTLTDQALLLDGGRSPVRAEVA